jgi:hypothetical protein
MKTQKMITHILEELERARTKFPGNKHQLTAMNEEVGELNQAILQNHYTPKKKSDSEVYWEAVQTAAMAIRVGTEGDSTFNYIPH